MTETRLLRDVATVGEVNDDLKRAGDNLMITGDSGDALRALTRLPEFAKEYRGKVKLVYIDPPFNTGQAFDQYDDGLEHSVWLTMLRDRLILIRDLLAEDGSVWVHLDDAEAAYARVVLDEIFGRSNFVATIIWEKADSPRNSARQFSTDHDYIHVYSKRPDWVPNKLPRTDEANSIYENPDGDPKGPWYPGDPFANKPYSLGKYKVTGPTGREFQPPPGRYWRISEERFWDLDSKGAIWWGPTGDARPSIKRYLSEVSDLVPRTLWRHPEVGSNRTSKNEMRKLFPGVASFATPKPERFMERVLQISTQPGDIVLDCFGGSGTTAAVAHKMNRRWVTIEREPDTVATYLRPRLEMVVSGEDRGGISESVGWEKGGGFRQIEVAPSMYELLGNRLLLAPWVVGEAFTEAACAQIPGFELERDAEPPFVGRKGRQRLAVVDGLITESTVRAAVEALNEDEKVLVVGKSYLREAASLLEKLSPGSRIKKAPQDLLDMKGRVLR
ncbi:site-specific DNA-methyltransferase [Streptomyces sp. Ru73]|uniref:site-specific DNA-methyltransferase n=1 Tax=Streptomyces sp. Ru73 TaxID=2080748 RepID=UPI001CA4810E|nr:site-specific DNA-methyltransferase [Streptomyces sp. Ru73]